MRKEYYTYDEKKLLSCPKIQLQIMDKADDVFKAMADEMIDIILKKAKENKHCVLIVPVGPVGQYPYFVERVNRERISLKHCYFVNMDEYLDENLKWISIDDPLSFRGFMKRNVYDKIDEELNVDEDRRVFPDPDNLGYIPELIKTLGGVDAVFGGIGINGHIAFNEAQKELSIEEFINLKTRILKITPETRTTNCIGDLNGALEDMPTHCITVGFNEIYNASRISLGVFRPWHKAVIRRAAYGEVSSDFPVTILQNKDNVLIRMPRSVAEL